MLLAVLTTVNQQVKSRAPNLCLADSRSEKPARGALFAALQRQLSLNTILIVDAPNYIKGFRYQMYCAAREMKLRVCTVSPPIACCYLLILRGRSTS